MKSILIIDDNNDLLLLLKETLQSKYRILTSLSGREGLYSLIHNKPDLILLDIMMKGLNGFDILKLLRNDTYTKDTPIIIISALNEEKIIEKTRSMGANGYLKKPFQLSSLLEIIDGIFEKEISLDKFQVF